MRENFTESQKQELLKKDKENKKKKMNNITESQLAEKRLKNKVNKK